MEIKEKDKKGEWVISACSRFGLIKHNRLYQRRSCSALQMQTILVYFQTVQKTVFLGQNQNPNSPGLPCCSGMLENAPAGVKAVALSVAHWCLTRHVAGVVMARILHCSPAAPHSTLFDDVTGLDRRHCRYGLPESHYTLF